MLRRVMGTARDARGEPVSRVEVFVYLFGAIDPETGEPVRAVVRGRDGRQLPHPFRGETDGTWECWCEPGYTYTVRLSWEGHIDHWIKDAPNGERPVSHTEALGAALRALRALPPMALGDMTPPSTPGYAVIDLAYGPLLPEVARCVEAALAGESWHEERLAGLMLALERAGRKSARAVSSK